MKIRDPSRPDKTKDTVRRFERRFKLGVRIWNVCPTFAGRVQVVFDFRF